MDTKNIYIRSIAISIIAVVVFVALSLVAYFGSEFEKSYLLAVLNTSAPFIFFALCLFIGILTFFTSLLLLKNKRLAGISLLVITAITFYGSAVYIGGIVGYFPLFYTYHDGTAVVYCVIDVDDNPLNGCQDY